MVVLFPCDFSSFFFGAAALKVSLLWVPCLTSPVGFRVSWVLFWSCCRGCWTSACSLLIRGWLSALSEPWISRLPSDRAKLVGREARRCAQRCPGNLWCVSQSVWHGLLLLTFPWLICDGSPGAGEAGKVRQGYTTFCFWRSFFFFFVKPKLCWCCRAAMSGVWIITMKGTGCETAAAHTLQQDYICVILFDNSERIDVWTEAWTDAITKGNISIWLHCSTSKRHNSPC